MAKKNEELPEGEMPKRFEIIPHVSVLKINRERDRRMQMATSISMILSVALLLSVAAMVYQAVLPINYIYVAQDIRNAQFTELKPIPDAQKLKQAKMNKLPGFNEQADVQRLEEMMAERAELLRLFDPAPPAAPASVIAPAEAASAAAGAASAPGAIR